MMYTSTIDGVKTHVTDHLPNTQKKQNTEIYFNIKKFDACEKNPRGCAIYTPTFTQLVKLLSYLSSFFFFLRHEG